MNLNNNFLAQNTNRFNVLCGWIETWTKIIKSLCDGYILISGFVAALIQLDVIGVFFYVCILPTVFLGFFYVCFKHYI